MHHLYDTLKKVGDALKRNNIFFVLSSGTLLGAVRAGELIAHDHDFDFEVHIEDKERILALNGELAEFGIELRVTPIQPLTMDNGTIADVVGQRQIIRVYRGAGFLGDLFLFTTFSDGILRRYDPELGIYLNPRHQTPAWFWEGTEVRTLYGDEYPVPRAPEVLLESMYGTTWRTPLKAGEHGKGAHKRGGGVVYRRQQPLVRYALDHGWDTDYSNAVPWPQKASFVNSLRARRLVVWSEPEAVTGNAALDYESEAARVIKASKTHEARKLIDSYVSTGAQTAFGALELTEQGQSKVIWVSDKLAKSQAKTIARLKKKNALLVKRQKARAQKIRYVKRNPLMAILRYGFFKLTGRRGRWWRQ